MGKKTFKPRTLTIRLKSNEAEILEGVLKQANYEMATDLFKHLLSIYPDYVECRENLRLLKIEYQELQKSKEIEVKQANDEYQELRQAILKIRDLK